MRITFPAALFAALILTSPAHSAESATATLAGPDGAPMGTVTLTEGHKGVLISVDLHGLAPGGHGFHIHEAGTCAPDFAAAGGHYNPGGAGHGLLDAGGHHAGDTPNIFAAADGTARADFFTGDVTFAEGAPNSLFGANGTSIIVHEKPDTYGADAGAGGRVACGVITRN
jgi:Cu-Zn family superoxide dismutase